MLASYKVDIRTRNITREEEGHFNQCHSVGRHAVINVFASTHETKSNVEIEKFTNVLENVSASLWKLEKWTEIQLGCRNPNHNIIQVDLIDINWTIPSPPLI